MSTWPTGKILKYDHAIMTTESSAHGSQPDRVSRVDRREVPSGNRRRTGASDAPDSRGDQILRNPTVAMMAARELSTSVA